MNYEEWLDKLIAPDARNTAAQKIGVASSTISRQLGRGKLLPETIIDLCRAYGKPPVTGLVETGYLNESEVMIADPVLALRRATNHEILLELLDREERRDQEAIDLFDPVEADIEPLHPPLREVPPVAVDEFDPATYTGPMAADSSPHEPGPGDEGYHDGP